jgi:hypothetical protein
VQPAFDRPIDDDCAAPQNPPISAGQTNQKEEGREASLRSMIIIALVRTYSKYIGIITDGVGSMETKTASRSCVEGLAVVVCCYRLLRLADRRIALCRSRVPFNGRARAPRILTPRAPERNEIPAPPREGGFRLASAADRKRSVPARRGRQWPSSRARGPRSSFRELRN